jgi:uncharacterized protein (TIGR02453 family)
VARAGVKSENPLDVRTALRFLRGLRDNNDRSWFAANRGVYDETIKPQWEAFVAGLLIRGGSFDERLLHVDPRRCIFRMYRDTRFSNDKSPYKPHLSAFLSPRGWRGTTPGFYVQVRPAGESLFAAGIYVPEKPVLLAIRERLADGDADFTRILTSKRLAPYLPVDTDPLKVMPRGYDRDHPRAAWIRARRFMVRKTFSDKAAESDDLFALMRTAMRDAAPFVAWLDQFVSAARAQEPDEEFSSSHDVARVSS